MAKDNDSYRHTKGKRGEQAHNLDKRHIERTLEPFAAGHQLDDPRRSLPTGVGGQPINASQRQ
jgi:hypothetical protein